MKYPEYFTDNCFIKEDAEVIGRKIEALTGAMTLEEKAELLHGGMNPPEVGQVANGGYIKGVPRLGVPEIRMYDGPAGVTSVYDTTGLPAEEMLASSWSRELAYGFGKVTGSENRMISGNCQLGAEVDLVRTTHFNRTRDMLGEDPFLAGELAVPLVKGIQDQHVMAVLKHFAGYVVSANPANSPDTVIDEQTMHELYLTPFERAIQDGGACGVMTAYNRINGPYAANASKLLLDVLRQQWEFQGLTMCDWGGNHSFSLTKGMDIEMPMGAYNSTERLLKFVESGKIKEADLDRAVGHILWALGAVGYLSQVKLDEQGKVVEEAGRTDPIRMPDTYAQGAKLREENAEIARQVAVKGAVLLKNDAQTLPLTEQDCRQPGIAMIGMGAVRPICGYGQERSYGTLSYMKAPAEMMGSYLGPGGKVEACAGLDYIGTVIPSDNLFTDEAGTTHGLTRYYGISQEDGYRPPAMSMGGAGEEFKGVATRDETEDDDEGSLDFAPVELFMPGSDAADMPGHATGDVCCVDGVLDFACEPGNTTYKNGKDGRAFEKDSAYTWKGFLRADEDGEYLLSFQAIGGVAVFKMDVDGTGYRDIGLIKMREGTQWPWGNLVCTPEGMELCVTRVRLEKDKTYPVVIYGKALLDTKDLQLRLSWVTPSAAAEMRQNAVRLAGTASKTVFCIHSGFRLNEGSASGGLSFGDDIDLTLDREQTALLLDLAKAAHAHGGKLIVAAYNGSAFAMKPWIGEADALLYMWMPGQSGGDALARLLLGLDAPGGKLPQSFPAVNEDTPVTDTPEHVKERCMGVMREDGITQVTASEGLFSGYRWYDKEEKAPLFEFGFGLSYTSFEYSGLEIAQGDEPRISFTVKNTGKRAGDEIAQAYLGAGQVPDGVMAAPKLLCGFARLENMQPGEERRVEITIPERARCYWSVSEGGWEKARGERSVYVGASSRDIRLVGTLTG